MEHNKTKKFLPGLSSRIEYLGLLLMLMGSIFFNQTIFGTGFPVATQLSIVLCPISTTLLFWGDSMIWGKPGGSLSAETGIVN